MRELPILTTELTLQLERCVGPSEPGIDAHGSEVVRFGKTIASKKRGPWPPSSIFRFNSDDVGRLDEILGFFGDIDPLFFLVHGGYKPAVGQTLHAAGYYLHDWRQTILYGLPAPEPAPLPANVTIEEVTKDTIDVAAETTAEGNEWPALWRETAKAGVHRSIGRPHLQIFLARYKGQPAGVGSLSKCGAADNWCTLHDAAVVPRFRGRGIHTALLSHRLHIAINAGYALAISGANFGSTSFRNQQRAGLRLGYVEATWRKHKPA